MTLERILTLVGSAVGIAVLLIGALSPLLLPAIKAHYRDADDDGPAVLQGQPITYVDDLITEVRNSRDDWEGRALAAEDEARTLRDENSALRHELDTVRQQSGDRPISA